MSLLENNLLKVLKRALLLTLSLLIIGLVIRFSLFFKQQEPEQEKIKNPPLVKVAILNGCGIKGAAAAAKNFLINNEFKNIDVISWDNVERGLFIYGKSIIVVKREDEKKLRYLMQITGISRRIYAVNEDAIEDLQIIIGDDYKTYFTKE